MTNPIHPESAALTDRLVVLLREANRLLASPYDDDARAAYMTAKRELLAELAGIEATR
jgi:hypothetical protein